METLSRKQREIREREALILDVARDLLLERGYLGLGMDRIAERIEYSKGTVYQHFSSKEDLLVALATQTFQKRLDLFERAATFQGRARERMQAVGVADRIFYRLYPQHSRSEQVIHATSVQSKAASEHLKELEVMKQRCFGVLIGIVRDAVAAGDLTLREDQELGDVTFGLWSISFGAHFLHASEPQLETKGIVDPMAALHRNQNALLDGFHWRPLMTEWDYAATIRRILETTFAEEAQQAGLL